MEAQVAATAVGNYHTLTICLKNTNLVTLASAKKLECIIVDDTCVVMLFFHQDGKNYLVPIQFNVVQEIEGNFDMMLGGSDQIRYGIGIQQGKLILNPILARMFEQSRYASFPFDEEVSDFWNPQIKAQLDKEKEAFKQMESTLPKGVWVAIKDGQVIAQDHDKSAAFLCARQKVGLKLFYFTQVASE